MLITQTMHYCGNQQSIANADNSGKSVAVKCAAVTYAIAADECLRDGF